MPERDLLIIGGGPAGLTAGMYASRARLDAELLERLSPGGQILNTELLENWPGEPEPISGFALADRFRDHALRFGLPISNAEATALRMEDQWKIVSTTAGEYRAKALILALGAFPRRIGIIGEAELTGKGVSYCATCDAPFYRDKDVAVIGGGDTAAEEALYLTRFARKVYMIHRRDKLRATAILAERIQASGKIEMLWNCQPLAIHGQNEVEELLLRDLKTQNDNTLKVNGVFVFVGVAPNTGWLPDALEKDDTGFLKTSEILATNIPGVFAAGDCRDSFLRQVVVATGEGAVAAVAAGRYLEEYWK